MQRHLAGGMLALAFVFTGSALAADQPPTTVSSEQAMQCDASKAQWALGKTLDDATISRLRRDAGATSVRVIEHGMMVTMEHNEARLTINLDELFRVRQVRCG